MNNNRSNSAIVSSKVTRRSDKSQPRREESQYLSHEKQLKDFKTSGQRLYFYLISHLGNNEDASRVIEGYVGGYDAYTVTVVDKRGDLRGITVFKHVLIGFMPVPEAQ